VWFWVFIVNCFTAWNMDKVKPKLFSRITDGILNSENVCCHCSRWNIPTMTLNWFRILHRNEFLQTYYVRILFVNMVIRVRDLRLLGEHKIHGSWCLTPYSLVIWHQHFGEISCYLLLGWKYTHNLK